MNPIEEAIDRVKKELEGRDDSEPECYGDDGDYFLGCDYGYCNGLSWCLDILEELRDKSSKDVVNKNKLVETIKHCMQYPDGLNRLLAIYEGEQND